MARRPIEKELIETLKENELDFIPRGIYHIQEIYDFIKMDGRYRLLRPPL